MSRLLHEFTGYTAASLCALGVDVSLLLVFVNLFSLRYIVAATLSFLAGASVAYALAVRIAFKEHRMRDRRMEFLSFIALGTVGLGVNALVIAAAVNYLGLHYLQAKCVAAACTFTCNFTLRRHFLFMRPNYVASRRLAP